MDTLSPSKRPVSPIITRANLRSVLLRLSSKNGKSETEMTIIRDATRRLRKCEADMVNYATELLLGAGWKFEAEIAVSGGVVTVYYRTRHEGYVFLKKCGDLTNEVINLVGSNILKDALSSGRPIRYLTRHGIKQRIFTNGWTPAHSHYVLQNFKGLIVLEDTSNVSMSPAARVAPVAVNEEKSIAQTANTTPVKKKRSTAFVNVTPPAKRANLKAI